MEVGNRGLWKNMKNQSFWRFFVTKSVGLRLPELLIGASDAEFCDLSFAMGPGAWFLCKYMIFLKNVRILASFGGQKSEMMDEMGRDGFKFGIFDMGRCALISGAQKCWFWPIFPNFLREKIDFSFSSPSSSPRTYHFPHIFTYKRLAPIWGNNER